MLTMLLISCAIVFGAWYLINNEYAFTKLCGFIVVTIIYIAGFPIFMLLNWYKMLKRFNNTFRKDDQYEKWCTFTRF